MRICSFTTSDKLSFLNLKFKTNASSHYFFFFRSDQIRSDLKRLNLIELNLECKHYSRLLFSLLLCERKHRDWARLSLGFMDICFHQIHPPCWLTRLIPSITVSNGRGPRALWSHQADLSSHWPSIRCFTRRYQTKHHQYPSKRPMQVRAPGALTSRALHWPRVSRSALSHTWSCRGKREEGGWENS